VLCHVDGILAVLCHVDGSSAVHHNAMKQTGVIDKRDDIHSSKLDHPAHLGHVAGCILSA
jgi:hypothetical protein